MPMARALVATAVLVALLAGCTGLPGDGTGGTGTPATGTTDASPSTSGSATPGTTTPVKQWWEECSHPATASWHDTMLFEELSTLDDVYTVPAQTGIEGARPGPEGAPEAELLNLVQYPTGNRGGWPAVSVAPGDNGGVDLSATSSLADEEALREWVRSFLERAFETDEATRQDVVAGLERTDPRDGRVELSGDRLPLSLRPALGEMLRTSFGPAEYQPYGQRLAEHLGNWSLHWHVPALRATFQDEDGSIEVQVTTWGHAEATAHGDDRRLLQRIDAAFAASGIPSRDLDAQPEGTVTVRRVMC